MPRGLYVDAPEHVTLEAYDDAPLQPHQVRVRTEFASIKHGTMFHLFSGESPFQNRRFDPALRLFVPRQETDESGGMVGRFIGNMIVGTVTATGSAVTGLRTGERVYGHGPVCETVTLAQDVAHTLPAQMTAADAVCLDPALFALGVVRDGRVAVGDNVVAFGLGAIGQFVVQLLALSGCLHTIAVDPISHRRKLAERRGADLALDPTQQDVAMRVRERLGVGADVAIEASGHYSALYDAMRTVRQCGRVAASGYYKGKAHELELGAEWFHNRVDLICSLPDWNNPQRDYPLWDRARMYDTLVAMFCNGALTTTGVVAPVVDFDDVPKAFLEIYHDPSESVKLGVQFR